MRFLYQYPDTHGAEGSMLDAGDLGDMAAAAEAAGFEGFTLTEHPAPSATWLGAGGHQTVDPFVALGYAAARTERIALMTYLIVAPYRNPLLLAKAAATLDLLSGGRFVLGVGTGYLKGEFRALGVDFDERNRRFDEERVERFAIDVQAVPSSGATMVVRMESRLEEQSSLRYWNPPETTGLQVPLRLLDSPVVAVAV